MTEAEWRTFPYSEAMLKFLRGKASDRKMRLFSVACCRRIWNSLLNERSRQAVEIAERYADGAVTRIELSVAYTQASDPSVWQFTGGLPAATAAALTAGDGTYDGTPNTPLMLEAVAANVIRVTDNIPAEWAAQCDLLRDIFGNPFRPVALDPAWRTGDVLALARQMYESRDFGAMPILADALQDAGCDSDGILNHCRDVSANHVRGCWVVDLVLDKA